jgi:hypothetical protein
MIFSAVFFGSRLDLSIADLALADEVIESRCCLLRVLTAAVGTHRRFNDVRSYLGSWG